ncbi:extracellular solute-binding protein [Kamptonema cortianum]|nr:extracellular solute-binding protein [Kamptonema cortianum]
MTDTHFRIRSQRPVLSFLLGWMFFLGLSLGVHAQNNPPDRSPGNERAPIEIVVNNYIPDWADNPYTIMINEFIGENPDIFVRPFVQLRLPAQAAGMAQGTLYLAFAGGIGPDVFPVWFHQLESWVNQGFVMDLSEFIGKDENGDGYIDDDEAKIQEWRDLPPALRRAGTINGKPYGLPSGQAITCIIYRRDIVREVTGSEEPPRTWDEFFRICQLASRNYQRNADGTEIANRRGFFADPNTFRWLPWLWSAGGREVVQVRTAADGARYEFSKEEIIPKSPTGENLAFAPLEWKATFASPEGLDAMEFYWRLFWQKWIRDPKTGEPVNLTDEQARAGRVTLPDGREIAFGKDDVYEGVSRGMLGDGKAMVADLFRKGEIVFYIGFAAEVADIIRNLSPSQVGLMAIPSPDGSRLTANIQPNYWWCLNSALAKEPLPKQRAAFNLVKSITGDNLLRTELEVQKQKGNLSFADPELLKKFGMEENINDIFPHWRDSLKEIKQNAQTEPYIGKWEPVSVQLIGQEIISRIIADRGFDYKAAMRQAENIANNKVLRDRDEEEMRKIRPYAYAIFAVVLFVFSGSAKKCGME